MSTCPACKSQDVITGRLGTETVLLSPHFRTYIALEEHHIFPEDGDRVCLSTALVEHAAVCTARRQQQARDRAQGKAQYQATHARKEAKHAL